MDHRAEQPSGAMPAHTEQLPVSGPQNPTAEPNNNNNNNSSDNSIGAVKQIAAGKRQPPVEPEDQQPNSFTVIECQVEQSSQSQSKQQPKVEQPATSRQQESEPSTINASSLVRIAASERRSEPEVVRNSEIVESKSQLFSGQNKNQNSQLKQQQHTANQPKVTSINQIEPIKSNNKILFDQQNANHLNHNQLIGGLAASQICKRRKLSYLQSLLLRRWPCFALGICIMSSLVFGILLSALTVYLMHGLTDCSGVALAMAAARPAHGPSALASSSNQMPPRPLSFPFESPIEQVASSLSSFSSSLNQTGAEPLAPRVALELPARPKFQRLPMSLWPQHYDLFVQPFIREPFNFYGKVAIFMNCSEATDRITFHTFDLNISEPSLALAVEQGTSKKPAPKITGLSHDKQLQYSIVHLSEPLEVGASYKLSMDFEGYLNDDLAGFYKIQYERPNSTEATWIAATQFQATDARRAFPCFDEPLYKATFSIQIKHWKNMTALSNMPIINREDSQDGLWVTDTFDKSKRMSTYLVAYAVTNFESRSKGNISVWTRPGFADSAQYALDISGKILRHYEQFFGIEYPLPKMDMIALPDFNAGAMENWGLITYRETAMLYDEASSSVANKQRVATVVAHELAHQWFGNLVTPKWWDDLWLNEGFASFVEYIGVDHVEPKWRMLDQFVVEEVQNVFKMDALSSSHQISIPVNNPDEISEIFDHISYAKGASIIRMMNHFLSEDVFKLGLRRYLRALRYDNAEQSDLWAHLRAAYNEVAATKSLGNLEAVDVSAVMNSWTLQTGFPLVSLERRYDGSHTATLQQTRYRPAGVGPATKSNDTQRWEIPITLTWRSEQNWQPNTRLWLRQNRSEPTELAGAKLMPPSDDEWMLLNVQQVGYYRVNYDQRNWKMLINQLIENHTLISTTNRAQILDDIFELARSGNMDYGSALEATKYLRKERDYLPWDTVLMSFSYIDDMLQRTPMYGDWKDYIGGLTAPYYARYKDLDWTSEPVNGSSTGISKIVNNNDVLELYNMVNAIAWASQLDDHCIQKSKDVFRVWKTTGKNTINPALRYTAYCTAIEHGTKEDWDFLWKVYEKEQNASEKDRILRALGCSREHWILSRYLEWTFSKSKHIRRQDGAYVFRTIAKNNYGRDIAFNFMRERWSVIREFYGKTSFSLGSLIRSISTSMNTQVELNQLMNFYETIKADVGSGKRAFQIAIEEVESNVAWRNKNYKILEEWIQATKTVQLKKD